MAREDVIAYHEAGHAVIARALGVGVTHVAIFPTSDGVRAVAQTRSAYWLARADDAPAQIAGYETDASVSFAGPLAQHRYRPGRLRWEHEWRDDLAAATSYVARSVLLRNGVKLSAETQRLELTPAQVTAVDELQHRIFAETQALVEEHWSAIERVAQALMKRRILSDVELDALIAVSREA
jgi:hypothetical protein